MPAFDPERIQHFCPVRPESLAALGADPAEARALVFQPLCLRRTAADSLVLTLFWDYFLDITFWSWV